MSKIHSYFSKQLQYNEINAIEEVCVECCGSMEQRASNIVQDRRTALGL